MPDVSGRWRSIDLDAIRHNVARLKARLPAGAMLCAVVKANGYGHGAVPAAAPRCGPGADWLGVATVDRGRGAARGRLHRAGPDLRRR